MTAPRCSACPSAGRCVVDWTGHRRFCDHAESGDPVWRGRIAALSAAGPPVPDAPPAYPPVARQLATAAKAAVRFARSGLKTVGRAEYDRRRSICRACPLYDAAADRCRACGCNLKAKPWAASESCPKGRW